MLPPNETVFKFLFPQQIASIDWKKSLHFRLILVSNNKSERIKWNRFFLFVDNCNWYVGRSCLFFSRHSHHLVVVGLVRAARTMCVQYSLTMKMTFTFARNIFRATRMHATTHSMNGYCDNATSDIQISILKHFYLGAMKNGHFSIVSSWNAVSIKLYLLLKFSLDVAVRVSECQRQCEFFDTM